MTSNEFEHECTPQNAITLSEKESWSIPLFYDAAPLEDDYTYKSMLSTDLDLDLEIISTNKQIAL